MVTVISKSMRGDGFPRALVGPTTMLICIIHGSTIYYQIINTMKESTNLVRNLFEKLILHVLHAE